MRGEFANVVRGAVSSAFLTVSSFAFATPAVKLSPTDIQSTFFNGKPFTASTPSNVKFKMTFTADGKMKREPLGTGARGEGTWKLSENGFCTTWNGSKPGCFTLVNAGNNKWSVLRDLVL
ncbi:MAG TPA: hypothetical protein VGJ20_04315 [Xanthobacteraceae bacterium]|jgi:hypothetical protein